MFGVFQIICSRVFVRLSVLRWDCSRVRLEMLAIILLVTDQLISLWIRSRFHGSLRNDLIFDKRIKKKTFRLLQHLFIYLFIFYWKFPIQSWYSTRGNVQGRPFCILISPFMLSWGFPFSNRHSSTTWHIVSWGVVVDSAGWVLCGGQGCFYCPRPRSINKLQPQLFPPPRVISIPLTLAGTWPEPNVIQLQLIYHKVLFTFNSQMNFKDF